MLHAIGEWLRSLFARPTAPPVVAIEPPPVVEPPASDPPPADPKERKKRANTAALRNQLADAATSLIEQIAAPSFAQMHDHRGAREYEEALGYLSACDFHFIDELSEQMNGGSEWVGLHPDKDMKELMWPIDIGIVVKKDNGRINFGRLFTATAASMRGRSKIVPQRSAWLAEASIGVDGRWFAQMTPVGLINGTWLSLDAGMVRQSTASHNGHLESVKIADRQEIDDSASCMQSIALTERYHWHVAIGQANGPRVLLPTNPQGCLDLFKTREKRDGENRRAALRHWCHNHLRETGNREINYVRDHLRGVTEFNWRGFDACEIFVSEFDLEQNELFRLQAEEWRSKRKHNRVAVRIKRKKTAEANGPGGDIASI